MNVRRYVKRAYEADALSRDQLRNESNAFHHLLGQIEYLADVSMLDGHQKRISAKIVTYPHFDPKKTRVRA